MVIKGGEIIRDPSQASGSRCPGPAPRRRSPLRPRSASRGCLMIIVMPYDIIYSNSNKRISFSNGNVG